MEVMVDDGTATAARRPFLATVVVVIMVDDGDRAGHGDTHKRQLLYEGLGLAEHAVYLAQDAQRERRERQHE